MIRLIAIADDLSGAAETAAQFLPYSARTAQDGPERSPRGQTSAVATQVLLVPDEPRDVDFGNLPARFVVLETDNRSFGEVEADQRLGTLLSSALALDSGPEVIFLKVDSLLRGHLANQLGVLALHGPIIFAAALPALARSTVNGVVHSAGVPLHRTTLWSAEGRTSPETIAAALAPLATRIVDLQTVRGDPDELARVITTLAERNVVALCDAETPEDLDAITEAGLCHKGAHFAGASALGAALGRAVNRRRRAPFPYIPRASSHRDCPAPTEAGVASPDASSHVLLVVGSASTQSRTQLDVLSSTGVPVLSFSCAELLTGTADAAPVRAALASGPAAISIVGETIAPETSRRLAVALASFAAPSGRGYRMVLTGGETARAVLDALGVRWLEPLAEIEHGAVLSRTDQNALIVTRPGSFGEADSLLKIVERLSSYPSSEAAPEPSGPGKDNP